MVPSQWAGTSLHTASSSPLERHRRARGSRHYNWRSVRHVPTHVISRVKNDRVLDQVQEFIRCRRGGVMRERRVLTRNTCLQFFGVAGGVRVLRVAHGCWFRWDSKRVMEHGYLLRFRGDCSDLLPRGVSFLFFHLVKGSQARGWVAKLVNL